MPTPAAEEPLANVSVKLFTKDVEYLKRRYGQGYTTKIRSIVREHLKILKNITTESETREILDYHGEQRDD